MLARPALRALLGTAVCLLGAACAKGNTLAGGVGGSGGSATGAGGAQTSSGSGGGGMSTSHSSTSSTASTTTTSTGTTTVMCTPVICGGCPCTSDECIMCCAYQNKVNACNAQGCYCF